MASPPSPFDNLPEISFAQIDVTALQTAIITGFLSAWEADTGETLTLLPSDRRYNFLSSATAWLIGAYATLDTSAKQNLIPFATGGFLDNLGAFFDIGAFSGTQSRGKRLPASAAATDITFSLSGPVASASIIPKGTQVASASTGYIFSTDSDLTILSGFLAGTVSTTCTVTGAGANDLGDVSTLVNWSGAFVISAINDAPTQGGADVQSDEDFRLQLYSASDSYSNAGSYGAYEFFARSASPAIADVSVAGPEDIGQPGDVLVTVLLQNGEFPDQPFLDDVVAPAVNPENIRDLCANVRFAPPSGIPYTVQVRYWIDSTQVNNALGVQSNVNAALTSWVTGNSIALGGSINPSTLEVAVMSAGASYVLVDAPVRIPLSKWQVGVITDDPIAIYQGTEDDLPI
jgi:phage-related baseplate assembly protein